MATKRKHDALNVQEKEEPVDPSDELMFLALGGGSEVGRSCHIIQYKGKTVMLDAGLHAAYDGLAALPFYDEFDLSTVDILLISHFHIDHAASLPYVLSKTNFRGRIFMTHSTKAIYKWLIQDSVRVGNTASSSENANSQLYTEADHLSTFPQIEAIDYHTTHTINSIRITPYPAGHVLGAAMFLIEIAGLKVLFTGDYSRENDRHLIPAEVPRNVNIDVLITESTFGISSHVPRLEREAALMKSITSILNRGGRALLPVFALGRAQELLLILDEYWAKHPEYQQYPIYYASSLARKCMVVYQTYIGSMNDNIKRMFRERMADAEAAGSAASSAGPWDFRFIRSLKNLDRFDDVGGCVMLASPGFMQSGVSRELLERWAPDERNGVVITGYSVEGTMARTIMQEPESIPAVMTNRGGMGGMRRGGKEDEQVTIPRRCTVQEYSFAAHVDGTENTAFIEEIGAPVVILVHGEKHNMNRLKSRLLSLNKNKTTPTKIFNPANCDELRIPIRTDKTAKVVGKLAERIKPPAPLPPINEDDADADADGQAKRQQQECQIIRNAVLVQNDLKLSLMAPEDLREYAGLTTTTIACRQRLTLASASADLIRWALHGTFGAIKDLTPDAGPDAGADAVKPEPKDEDDDDDHTQVAEQQTTTLQILDAVTVSLAPRGAVTVEWQGNVLNDGIADAVLAVLMSVESAPAAVQHSSRLNGHHHHHHHDNADADANDPPAPADEEDDDYEPELEDAKPPAEAPKERQDPHGIIAKLKATSLAPRTGHPHAAGLGTLAQFSRLLLLLEAQFGADAIEPIAEVRAAVNGTASGGADADGDVDAQQNQAPVSPGLKIIVPGGIATLWLDDLSVDTKHEVLRQRVRAIVERGVECMAPVWAGADGLQDDGPGAREILGVGA